MVLATQDQGMYSPVAVRQTVARGASGLQVKIWVGCSGCVPAAWCLIAWRRTAPVHHWSRWDPKKPRSERFVFGAVASSCHRTNRKAAHPVRRQGRRGEPRCLACSMPPSCAAPGRLSLRLRCRGHEGSQRGSLVAGLASAAETAPCHPFAPLGVTICFLRSVSPRGRRGGRRATTGAVHRNA